MFTPISFPDWISSDPAFTPADLYQARFTASLASPAHRETIAALTALLSRSVREGHVCLDLHDHMLSRRQREAGRSPWKAAAWAENGVVSPPGGNAPLVLDGSRLYFSRLFHDEDNLARSVGARTILPPRAVPAKAFTALFPARPEPDWQAVACFAALRNHLTVITGGPGTGKTRTVANILLLAAQFQTHLPMRIGLAAPTGKAAARMSESLSAARPHGQIPATQVACLTGPPQTIHRLLGLGGSGARHHRDNPLALDLLVVDEASMLDLELAARLLDALPPTARLVLLGDRAQLTSVEAGAVLANLCPTEAVNRFSPAFVQDYANIHGIRLPTTDTPSPLTDHVVELSTSHRFSAHSGIGRAATLIRSGLAEDTARLLATGTDDLGCTPCPDQRALRAALAPLVREAFGPLKNLHDPREAFARFGRLRLLTPIHQGSHGTRALNGLVAELLGAPGEQDRRPWYCGRPIMILDNEYELGLFNGDVGLVLAGNAGETRVFFPHENGGFRALAPARLPRHETCYAMTVHKSQGSEFDHAVLILPDTSCPILGRELLYTALTRARKRFTLLGRPEQAAEAVRQPTRRDSGLGERIAAWST